MKKKKLKELKVESFITSLNEKEEATVKGGIPTMFLLYSSLCNDEDNGDGIK